MSAAAAAAQTVGNAEEDICDLLLLGGAGDENRTRMTAYVARATAFWRSPTRAVAQPPTGPAPSRSDGKPTLRGASTLEARASPPKDITGQQDEARRRIRDARRSGSQAQE